MTIQPRWNKRLVARLAIILVISIIVGVGVYSWNAKTLGGNAMPMPFGVGCSVVLSGSMEPELSVDDLIFVRERDTYAVGDVVVFQDGHTLVVHKIIAIDGSMITTKGTANSSADEPFDVKYVKGAVVASIPRAGEVVTLLRHPLVVLSILGIAVALLVQSYRREREHDQQQEQQQLDALRREIEQLKRSNQNK